MYNNDNLPHSMKMPKLAQKIAKYNISYPKIAKLVLNFLPKSHSECKGM